MPSTIAAMELEIELARTGREAVDAADVRPYLIGTKLLDMWAGRDFERREQAALALFEASGMVTELLTWHGVDQATAVNVVDTLQLGLVDMTRG